jgi:hypothetical protein
MGNMFQKQRTYDQFVKKELIHAVRTATYPKTLNGLEPMGMISALTSNVHLKVERNAEGFVLKKDGNVLFTSQCGFQVADLLDQYYEYLTNFGEWPDDKRDPALKLDVSIQVCDNVLQRKVVVTGHNPTYTWTSDTTIIE